MGDEKHHTTDAETYAKIAKEMLEVGSMNAYMFIGGTNFGFTSGANHYEKYAPDVTSYDYDALLSECGDVTEKYYAVRKVLSKYTDKPLPPVPANRKKRAYGKVKCDAVAETFGNLDNLSVAKELNVPLSMEDLGFGYGYVVYETVLHRIYEKARISFEDIGDRAHVYVNDERCGTVYVNEPPYEVCFSAKAGDVLTVICENMGRTNFGHKMMRKKGIVGRCLINNKIHFGWRARHLPMDNLDKLVFDEKKVVCDKLDGGNKFYRFRFYVDGPLCDTFLRTDAFKKGFAVLNNFNLGRYWEKGPQKTLYVPASLLKKGENELIIYESDGLNCEPVAEFVAEPDLG